MNIIIKPREKVTTTEYEIQFWNNEDGCGFGFPCDKDGKICNDLQPAAYENYKYALEHPEKFDIFNKVKANTWSYMEPAQGKCSHCGTVFSMNDEYLGACECPKCHRWYNLFGQPVNDPETWDKGEDW